MAIIRAECHGICNKDDTRSTYDAIVETVQDLNGVETETWGVGSMAFVKSEGKIYLKGTDSTWAPLSVN